jgi:hypothetical protein
MGPSGGDSFVCAAKQVTDVAALLREAPERLKRKFQRLGVAFTVSIVSDEQPQPFLRAVGTTDFSASLAGVWCGLLYYRSIAPAIGTVKSQRRRGLVHPGVPTYGERHPEKEGQIRRPCAAR